MNHTPEMQRVYEAERRAKEFIGDLSPRRVRRCGEANLLRELTHEFLLNGVQDDSDETRKDMKPKKAKRKAP